MTGPRNGCRACPPAETVERLRPFFRQLGITRVANVTGLDKVGIPVVNVYRPNARSNAVVQGKGLDLASAKASALMEALETWCAERILRPLTYASVKDMAGERVADWRALPRLLEGAFDERTKILWIEGRDLSAGSSVWVPFELVQADFTAPSAPGAGHFLSSTNGLAAGNVAAEAIGHGLCEVIERDAATLFDVAPANYDARRVALESVDDPDCCALIERFERAGIAVAVWDMTSDVGVPAFRVHAMEKEDGPGVLDLPAEGQGCHLDRGLALARALTEAAQGRVTVISGTREDIGGVYYDRAADPHALARWRTIVLSASWGRTFHEIGNCDAATAEASVDEILARLRAAGLDQAVAVDLGPEDGLPGRVVRMLVPGLEAPLRAGCTLGARGARRRSG